MPEEGECYAMQCYCKFIHYQLSLGIFKYIKWRHLIQLNTFLFFKLNLIKLKINYLNRSEKDVSSRENMV
jgi:hypothetical protein